MNNWEVDLGNTEESLKEETKEKDNIEELMQHSEYSLLVAFIAKKIYSSSDLNMEESIDKANEFLNESFAADKLNDDIYEFI